MSSTTRSGKSYRAPVKAIQGGRKLKERSGRKKLVKHEEAAAPSKCLSAIDAVIGVLDLSKLIAEYAADRMVWSVGGWGNGQMETRIETIRASTDKKSVVCTPSTSVLFANCWDHALVLDDELDRVLVVGGRSRILYQLKEKDGVVHIEANSPHPDLYLRINKSNEYARYVGTNYRDGRANSCFMVDELSRALKRYTFSTNAWTDVSWLPSNGFVHNRGTTMLVVDDEMWCLTNRGELLCLALLTNEWSEMPFIDEPYMGTHTYWYLTYVAALGDKGSLLWMGRNAEPKIWRFDLLQKTWSLFYTITKDIDMSLHFAGPMAYRDKLYLFAYEKSRTSSNSHVTKTLAIDVESISTTMAETIDSIPNFLHRSFVTFLTV